MIRWFLLPLLLATSVPGATPSSRIRRPVDVVGSPSGSHVLVANRRSGTVSVIDRRTRRVITEIDIGGRLSALAGVPGRDWVLVTDEAGGELIAIGCNDRFDVSWRGPVLG